MKFTRKRLPWFRNLISIAKDIYFERGIAARRKTYWQISRIINFLRFGLFKNRNIKRMNLLMDTEIIYVTPDRIKYILLHHKINHGNNDAIKAGNWDLRRVDLKNNDIYCLFMEYLTKGIPLTQANYPLDWICNTEKEFTSKCKEIDELYQDIKTKGYKTQRELGNNDLSDEVKVQIDRKGAFLLEDGLCRVAVAKVLGIQSIPVVITRRHYKWAKFRFEVNSYSREQLKGAYQQIIHPDFQKIRFQRRDDRWEIIANNLPFRGGNVLDLGSNWGYFCHKFEDLGFNCFAVENNYRWIYFLKKFKEIEEKKFEIVPRSLFDFKRKKYDIVLALSIFHHLLMTKELFDRLTGLLDTLEMKAMFFETHAPGEGKAGAYIDFGEDGFVDYVLQNSSCLSESKLLGRNERGRNMYLLT